MKRSTLLSRLHLILLTVLMSPAVLLATLHHAPAHASPGYTSTATDLAIQDEQGDGPFLSGQELQNSLRLEGPVQLPTLDPALVKDLSSMFLVRQVFAGLMRFDDELNPVPALAEQVEVSEDGLTYRFTLNAGSRFYSGDQITADDVVFSLTRALDPATANGDATALAAPTFLADILGARELLAGESSELVGVKAIDDRIVEITLAQPRSTFLMRLASAPASIVDSGDMGLGETWWQSPNASGPFGISHFQADAHVRLEPNSHFVLGPPKLDSVFVRLGTEAFGALNLYETGLIDVAGVDYLNLERFIDPANPFASDLRVSPLFAVEYIAFRSDVEPLDDPAIRQALLAGYPSDQVAMVTFNERVGSSEGIIPDAMLGVDRWDTGREYDLELARQLIVESAYGSAGNVPPITVYTSVPNRAESFRDVMERDLGLRVDVVTVEWQSYLTGLANREYPAYLLYWGADYPDPESMLLTLFGSGVADNYVDYSNTSFDDLLSEAAREQNAERRVDLYQQANQLLLDDAIVLPLYYDVAYTLVRPQVQDLKVTPLGILYLDRVWIDLDAGT
jgi:oligopeptide transport system substrate-binding protein